ncbi:MAG: VCBS repeat-containing protein [Saprospiraceae bacterium]|nr:VCBS repeat-containing protein [Saprospiraceae bacterium]
MDLYVLNHDQACRLYRNNGDGSFTDVIGTSGLNALDYTAFEVVTGDFNNDGFCDVLTDLQQACFWVTETLPLQQPRTRQSRSGR